jgi:general transcription factor 3C polypeptide 4
MNSPLVYTALNVPTATSYPSIDCLQWSADGQACFVTKTGAYIMVWPNYCSRTILHPLSQTPEHGIHLDTSSVVRSLGERDGRDGVLSLGWFRTIIQFDKTDVTRWPEYSQCSSRWTVCNICQHLIFVAWGTVSLGSIDVALWAIAFSPSNLSPDARCVNSVSCPHV